MTHDRPIVISTRTLLTALALVLAVMLAFVLREVLVTIFVAAVLSAALDPWIGVLERRGLPRLAALAILFFGILGIVVLIVVTFVPVVAEQVRQLAASLPAIYQKSVEFLRGTGSGQAATMVENALHSLSQGLGEAARSLFGRALSLVQGVASVFGVLILTFYLAMDQKGLRSVVVELAPLRERTRVERLFDRVKQGLGLWLRGQVFLGIVVGVLSYVGLLLLHVKFALVLALLAGVTELIPVIGPFIGAVPAILVTASDHAILGLWVALLYVVIQQLENHLLVPRIMAEGTGLNPIAVIIAILVAAKLAGIVGVLLAVPAAIIVKVVVDEWLEQRSARQGAGEQEAPTRVRRFE